MAAGHDGAHFRAGRAADETAVSRHT